MERAPVPWPGAVTLEYNKGGSGHRFNRRTCKSKTVFQETCGSPFFSIMGHVAEAH